MSKTLKRCGSETLQDICKKAENDEELKIVELEFQKQVIAMCLAIV